MIMEKQKILIVDDQPNFIASLRRTLNEFKPNGKELEILEATTEQGVIAQLRAHPDIKLLLLDYVIEHEDSGYRVLKSIREILKNKTVQIYYLTGEIGNEDQRRIVDRDSSLGLNGFIRKNPWDTEGLKSCITIGIETYDKLVAITSETNAAHEEVEKYKTKLRKDIEEKMGKGKVISKVFDQIEKYANTDIPILLEGETGTGKELIANYLWNHSSRKEMRILNCGSLSPELAGSELFGHSKGAFTSADSETTGILKIIDGGILFLDEINSLPLGVQVKLLRVIESGNCERIGDKKEFKVNVRIIAAGNKPFQELIEKGEFREDLYERFSKKIYIPTLKERIEDIDHFIKCFLNDESNKYGKQVSISDEAQKLLAAHEWKRNVRQLKNAVANLVIEVEPDKKTKTYIIQPELVKEYLQEKHSQDERDRVLDKDFTWETAEKTAMQTAIKRVLKITNGNNEEAISLLKIARGTYFTWKKKLGITD